MDPKDREELCNSGADEETIARQKKRSRRVSFAELTSVHVFDRDEDYGTPPDLNPSSENHEEVLGFHRDSGDSDDSKELVQNEEDDDENGDDDERELFVRSMDSSSPGSAVGSVTSNDEENFFGPVSSSFIRPGQLSDADSDENRDVTLDSTTFTMHFRSLLRSDSVGSLKTPTRDHLSFEVKTPTENSMPTKSGSFSLMTEIKKPIPLCSVSGGAYSGGSDSNDMSLIVENSQRYDYGKLSPTLNALLAEGNKDFHATSVSDGICAAKSSSYLDRDSRSSVLDERKNELVDLKDSSINELNNVGSQDTCVELISDRRIILCKENGESSTPVQLISCSPLSTTKNLLPDDASICQQSQNPHEPTKESGEDAPEANGDFGADNSDSFVPMDKKQEMGLFTEHDCQDLEESPKGGKHSSSSLYNSGQDCGSPLAGSDSSLCAKGRQIFSGSAVSFIDEKMATPSASKKLCSSLNKESISSTVRSISKFKIYQMSPITSTLEIEADNSSKSFSCSAALDGNSKKPELKPMNASFSVLDEQFLSVGWKKEKQGSSIEMDSCGFETPKHINNLKQAEGSETILPDGEYGNPISVGLGCNGQPNKLMAVALSPSQSSGSAKKMERRPLANCSPTGGGFVTSGPDSLLMKTTLDSNANEQVNPTADKLVYSPLKRVEKTLFVSLEHKGILSSALKQQETKFVSLDVRQDAEGSRENVSKVSHLTPIAGKLGTLCEEKISHSRSPLININSEDSRNFIKWKGMDNKELYHVLQKGSGNMMGYGTPMQHRATPNIQSESLQRSSQTGTYLAKFKEKLFDGDPRASLYESTSRHVHDRGTNVPQHGKGLHVSQKVLSFEGADNSTRKRRSEETILTDKGHLSETERLQKSPKILEMQGSMPKLISEIHTIRNIEVDKIEGSTKQKHWSDVFSRFSDAVEQLFSPLTAKLNTRKLEILEDTLGQLQKVKKYEKLCTEIWSQEMPDGLDDFQKKRVAEATSLQHIFAFEQAKLLLVRMKRERLFKSIQRLQSGIWESQILNNSMKHLCVPGARDVQNKESHLQSLLVNSNKKIEDTSSRLSGLRQELGALNQQIRSLTKSFHAFCKMKGEPSCDEMIMLVNEQLQKRKSCRSIRKDSQLWDLEDLDSKRGYHNFVLNYHSFLIQRFTINCSPISSISISNELNEANISNSFPNISAFTAFAFVFNAEAIRKHISLKCLAQEIQTTNSLLGNLLDVIEEVLVARLEIPNLIQTRFHSPCAERLDLELCFIDLKTGKKVTSTLDMTYLNHGIYPSDLLPSQLKTQGSGKQRVQQPPPPLSDGSTSTINRSELVRFKAKVSQGVRGL
ncbi:PREDICTED: uncharacterized protein LOC104588681 isoform X2 [Nelumbo nucifera]|uniref:Uncharacterized protein LOC104588681 isoform X2 n=2 Tax=Nelumbo nucifera TaxID=4432 RepID=A0A1U7Z2X3_NELNU|nr:PREDICTED: uncharacterized protein LOC104588681 isoform X2 [Nelumbo nucifera]